MKLRRLRDGDVVDNGDIVLIRGGDLDPDILCADSARYYSIYGVYGISVFAASSHAERLPRRVTWVMEET
jgi:hypothetical protein